MHKLVLLLAIVFLLNSCFQSGNEKLDFTKNVNKFELIPKKSLLTTSCRVVFKGNLDCDAIVKTRNSKKYILKAGEVDFSKNFECYDDGIVVTILTDSCTTKSNLSMGYTYSAQYFGQK